MNFPFVLYVVPAGILVILFAFFVRVKPIWKSRYRGWDAYYFLLCVEEFRKRKKLPIVLPPYFLLDAQEQWYPPGFVVFLSLLPDRFVKKYYWALSPAVDCLIVAMLYALTCWITGNIIAAIVAGLLYSLSYSVILECQNLNSRLLACFLLIVTMVSLFGFADSGNLLFLVVAVLAGFFLLLSHKMSAQLLYFVLPLMSLVFWNPTYILVMLGIVAVAFIFSGGFFVKVLKGQYDILSFWNRNWKNLGAHQVYSSPIYGDEARDDLGRFFQTGFKGLIGQILYLGLNVFIVLLVFPLLYCKQLSLFDQQMLCWVALTYILAAVTLFIPRLRFYGEGYKYLRMIVFPVCYLAVTPLYYAWDIGYYFNGVLVLALAVSMVFILWRNKSLESGQGWSSLSMDSDLASVVGFLKGNDKVSVIMSVPVHLLDTIAYHCQKAVLWGTHNYGFHKVEPFWPVYRQPLEFFITKYGVSHVIVATNYVSPELLHLSPDKMVFKAGLYIIYEVTL